MKLKHQLLTGCLFTVLAVTSCTKNDDDELNNTDRDFMTKASISNTAEVDAANLAATKATNAAVKAFAQHMIMEHGMAQTDLKSLGTSVSYAVKDTIDPDHVAIKAKLMTLSGRQFDSAYIHTQVADHQATILNFQNEINNGQHGEVQNYANNYLPHIQSHYTRADSIANAYFHR